MESIGDKIRRLREQKGLTQKQLAELIGTTEASLSRYENNLREPKAEIISRLANALGVSADYLLGKSEEDKPWWEKDEPPTDIELEEFIKNNSNIKLMGNPLDEKTKDDVIMFLRAAHEFIKQKRKAEESAEEKEKKE
ncbi:helix-turn-helix domain-containing protein [Thermoanaerobacterium sp. DL9XJH110]|uniref:helix-turn-helix domain-containing protein n=1 Tax=Thermoanaerobacterium sp. DL9XJH110 TaxID=3386643 RepID=UPI003BB7F0F4